MRNVPVGMLALLVGIATLVSVGVPTPKSEAAGILPFPFPDFSDTGTIVEVADPDGGPSCFFFKADSGGVFTFNGVDTFNDGDRVQVSGHLCTTCLIELRCGIGAQAIVNAIVKLI